MKQLILLFGLALLPTSAFSVHEPLLARVTVYWASGGSGSDHWTRKHRSSTGVRLRTGHCAVDPRRIPYGSKLMLPDGPLVAVDTGRDVINRKAARRGGRSARERSALVIDRFFETKEQALSWARRNPRFMTVRVLPPNFPSAPAQALPPSPAISLPPSRTALLTYSH